MESKTRTCQSCKADFTIEPEDFEFYKKIDVPEPTWCPECRMQRRMAFRNEAIMHKRKCDGTGKDIISICHPDSSYKIYDHKYWWSDEWDAMEYGRKYDFKRPFFEQLRELFFKVPQISISQDDKSVNSEYCNSTIDSKNCYLVGNCGYSENLSYGNRIMWSKDSLDLYIVENLELCYENLYCYDSYKLFFSNHCHNCVESYFLYDCRNCQNCFGCVNLRNKKYHIFNKQYTKAEYEKKLKEFNLGSYESIVKQKKNYQDMYNKAIHKFAQITKAVNCTGNEIKQAKNCFYAFDTLKVLEDCKFANWAGYNSRDSYDVLGLGINGELFYESVDIGLDSAKGFFTYICWSCRDIQYSINCHSCSDLFGCVGLRKKQYCIFNKQYNKGEYFEIVKKIKKHMNDMPYTDKKGRVYKYGEFFPPEMSSFSYDETIANDHFPLTQEQIKEQGFVLYDKQEPESKTTIKAEDLPDNIKDVDNSILDEVIGCSNRNCEGSGVFKIIPSELEFYKKLNIPLPRLCILCRRRGLLKQRNPLKLWHRKCMKKGCNVEFETSYAPDRPEIVYCEECYLKEVG